jgi:AcrR family transcriptional regulator
MAVTANTGEPRQPLSRDRILNAALLLADRKGVEALSMRELGRELGVRAMSLYKHVANKDDVLDGIVDIVVSQIDLPTQGAEWRKAMGDRARSARKVFRKHPWIAALFESRLTRSQQTPVRLRYLNSILGLLRQNGFSVSSAYRALLLIDSYLYGFTLQEMNWQLEDGNASRSEEETVVQLLMETYPYLFETYAHAGSQNSDFCMHLDTEFDLGLELIFDALERLRENGIKVDSPDAPAPLPDSNGEDCKLQD